MKKVFLFLATAALFASCSDDLLEPNNGFQATNEKGITFAVVDDATRGMIDPTTFRANFFAEKDEISIWSDNVKKGGSDMADFSTVVTYKATRSEGNPNFTGVSSTDILTFKDYNKAQNADNTARFFVTYPKNQASPAIQRVTHSYDQTKKVRTFTVTPGIDLMSQTMSKGYMDMDMRLMYDYAEVTKGAKETVLQQNQSVGDRVQLRLISPVTAAFFNISDIDTYKAQFGNLRSITLTSEYSPLVPATSTTTLNVNKEDLVTISDKKYFKNELDYKIEEGKVVYSIPKDNQGKDITSLQNYTSTTTFPDVYLGVMKDDQIEFKVAADGKKTATWKKVAPAIVRSATLTYGNTTVSDENPELGAAIDNNTVMNLYILPTKDHTEKAENYTVVYKFEKATLTFPFTKDYDFDENGAAFNSKIADLKCVVTDGTTTSGSGHNNDRSLIINNGTLTDILVKDKDGKVVEYKTDGEKPVTYYMIQWGAEQISTYEFENITINTSVTNTEWTYLNTFKNAKTLTLSGANCTNLGSVAGMTSLTKIDAPYVKTVVKDAFGATANSKLTHLLLPAVTSFGAQKADFKFTALTDLTLTAYDNFAGSNEVLPEVFFNGSTTSGTKKTLVTVDLSGVSSLQAELSRHSGIYFGGFSALKTLHLRNDVIINPNEFSNSTLLATITGVLNITNASDAFSGCSALKDVQIKGTEIPAGTFKESYVERIHTEAWTGPGAGNADINKNLVQPTVIGAEAFKGNTKIVSLDFSKTTSIGAGAFNGATAFTGGESKTVTLPAAVTTVEANTFNGTAVEIFILEGVTKTEAMSLNSANVYQIAYKTSADLTIAFDNSKTESVDEGQVVKGRVGGVSIFVKNAKNQDVFKDTGYPYPIILKN